VNPRPPRRLPTAQVELEISLRLLLDKRIPEELVGDILKRAPLPGSLLLDPFQEIVIGRQRRSNHAQKCMRHASRSQSQICRSIEDTASQALEGSTHWQARTEVIVPDGASMVAAMALALPTRCKLSVG